jgi:elongation factor G
MEANQQGKVVEIFNETVGCSIPKEFIKPSTEGIIEAANNGVVAGYPVVDVIIRIIDGSFHDVDSSEMAFKMAGIFAFKDAMKAAKPILLEPIMGVEVTTPEEYQGDLIGDINRRRGKIMNVDSKNLTSVVKAEVPLAEMFGYVNTIRSLSRGRAAYSMEPSHFEQVPASVLAQVTQQKKG